MDYNVLVNYFEPAVELGAVSLIFLGLAYVGINGKKVKPDRSKNIEDLTIENNLEDLE